MKSLLVLLMGSGSLIFQANAQNSKDSVQIAQLVKTMEEGWAKKDGALFAKPFAENADYVVVNGTHLKGRMAIDKGHQAIFDSFYKDTYIKITTQSIRYLRPDIALVHIAGNLSGTSNGEKLDRNSMITIIAEKGAHGWQIAAFQNTNVQPPRN